MNLISQPVLTRNVEMKMFAKLHQYRIAVYGLIKHILNILYCHQTIENLVAAYTNYIILVPGI